MSLDVLQFDPEVYDSRLKAFMVSVEGEKLPVYLDTKKGSKKGSPIKRPSVKGKSSPAARKE
jgi:hypothetical protein